MFCYPFQEGTDSWGGCLVNCFLLKIKPTRWGKSRFVVICMENNTVINNYTRTNCFALNYKPTFAHSCIIAMSQPPSFAYFKGLEPFLIFDPQASFFPGPVVLPSPTPNTFPFGFLTCLFKHLPRPSPLLWVLRPLGKQKEG